jgi:hypothetical protein
MRFPLESTAVQWVWDSQQVLANGLALPLRVRYGQYFEVPLINLIKPLSSRDS